MIKNLIQVKVSKMSEMPLVEVEDEAEIIEVHVTTDDGSTFHIQQVGPSTLGIRTREGRLVVGPIAANYIELARRLMGKAT